jgi:hypothetical protein
LCTWQERNWDRLLFSPGGLWSLAESTVCLLIMVTILF